MISDGNSFIVYALNKYHNIGEEDAVILHWFLYFLYVCVLYSSA